MMFWILCTLAHLILHGVSIGVTSNDLIPSQCTLPAVEDICVHGNDKYFIAEGAPFQFFAYDAVTKTNVYFCEECWGSAVSSAYLYGWTSNTDDYYWSIGPDLDSHWSSCYVGNALGPNYNFDTNDCLYWLTYNGSDWNVDNDMSLSKCNAICYGQDVYPQTTTPTSESVQSTIDASTAWNGDLYFDFAIYGQDCMNPKLSFKYELIDHDATYENIQIYDNEDMLIATCNGGQNCGTFHTCVTDYSIDDVIEMNETYSITIHQTADIDNLCGDYIFNAVLTLACVPNDLHHNFVTSTKFVTSRAPAQTLQSRAGEAKGSGNSYEWIYTALGIVIIIVLGVAYCIRKMYGVTMSDCCKICCFCALLLCLKKAADKAEKEQPKIVIVRQIVVMQHPTQ